MQVKIEEIQDKGLELKEKIPPAVMDEALAETGGFQRKGEAVFVASLKKLAGRVLLKGAFDASLTCPCKRCVKDVELMVPVKFELNLVAAEKRRDDDDDEGGEGDDDGKSEKAGTFELTDADSELFDGKKIDLDAIIREQLVLSLPVSVLCKEDCKGLCTQCGQELNETDCGHTQKVAHPGLMKLKDIKLN